MGWYGRFRDALHAKPPPQTPLPPGPTRVRDWWQGCVCPCTPLSFVQEARAAGASFDEHARQHWVGGYELTPEEEAAFEQAVGDILGTMVAVMRAAEEQGVDWPDLEI